MNADYSTAVIGHPEKMVFRFDIVGYLFGRELYRKTFWCDSKKRGSIFAANYILNRVTSIACDRYRVEVFDGEKTETLYGGRAPKKKDPWTADVADIMRSYSPWDTTFKAAANQAGWKERLGRKRARGKNMRVGKGAGGH